MPQGPNQRFSLDFVSDQFTDGRRFRIPTGDETPPLNPRRCWPTLRPRPGACHGCWATYLSLPRTLSLAMRLMGGFPLSAECGLAVL